MGNQAKDLKLEQVGRGYCKRGKKKMSKESQKMQEQKARI